MHSKSDNKETIINDKTDEVLEEILSRNEIRMETSINMVVISYFIMFIYFVTNVIK